MVVYLQGKTTLFSQIQLLLAKLQQFLWRFKMICTGRSSHECKKDSYQWKKYFATQEYFERNYEETSINLAAN